MAEHNISPETRQHPQEDDARALQQAIVSTELEYPKYLCQHERRDYGILYWDPADRTNANLNHAVLEPAKIRDLKAVLAEIRDFYQSRGIQPRVRQPFTKGYFLEHASEFRTSGYDIQLFAPTHFMLLTDSDQIRTQSELTIRELDEWDPRIASDILIPDGNAHAVEQIRRNIAGNRYRVLVGYLDERAVSLAILFYGSHGVARVAMAETVEELRGRGYARELISAVVKLHQRDSRIPLYLWPHNVTAEKIFREAGFRDFFQEELAIATYRSQS